MGMKAREQPRQFRCKTEVELVERAPMAKIPLRVAEALGCKGALEIPVRAVIEGHPFHAVLRAQDRDFDSSELGFYEPYSWPRPIIGYWLYIYKDMRETVPIRYVGEELDIVFSYEEHPRGRRGRRIIEDEA